MSSRRKAAPIRRLPSQQIVSSPSTALTTTADSAEEEEAEEHSVADFAFNLEEASTSGEANPQPPKQQQIVGQESTSATTMDCSAMLAQMTADIRRAIPNQIKKESPQHTEAEMVAMAMAKDDPGEGEGGNNIMKQPMKKVNSQMD